MLKLFIAKFTYLGIRDMNKYCMIEDTIDNTNFYSDLFILEKDKEITIMSLNINRLKIEG